MALVSQDIFVADICSAGRALSPPPSQRNPMTKLRSPKVALRRQMSLRRSRTLRSSFCGASVGPGGSAALILKRIQVEGLSRACPALRRTRSIRLRLLPSAELLQDETPGAREAAPCGNDGDAFGAQPTSRANRPSLSRTQSWGRRRWPGVLTPRRSFSGRTTVITTAVSNTVTFSPSIKTPSFAPARTTSAPPAKMSHQKMPESLEEDEEQDEDSMTIRAQARALMDEWVAKASSSTAVLPKIAVPGVEESELHIIERLPAIPPLVAQTRACVLKPKEFFVAWQGVLTLAFQGLPPELEGLKGRVEGRVATLLKENPGSRWPKSTLGCLKDGKELSFSQLEKLKSICVEFALELEKEEPVVVDQLSVVLYLSRSLERRLWVANVPLQRTSQPDRAEPSPMQRQFVDTVMAEFDQGRLERYHRDVTRAGNRESHYRDTKVGATLVHFLKGRESDVVRRFKRTVEQALPGMYEWFEPDSLHVTLRALS